MIVALRRLILVLAAIALSVATGEAAHALTAEPESPGVFAQVAPDHNDHAAAGPCCEAFGADCQAAGPPPRGLKRLVNAGAVAPLRWPMRRPVADLFNPSPPIPPPNPA